MKQTIKTSRVAGQLEKMFRVLNSRFFGGELPEVVISLKKTAGAYGHFTTGKVWRAGEERRYEINISSASLNQECAFLAGVLVHEMVHEYCAEHGIKDTSNNGVYHNKNFKHIAETHGLEVEHHPKYGWTITRNAPQGRQQRCRSRNQNEKAQQHPQIYLSQMRQQLPSDQDHQPDMR